MKIEIEVMPNSGFYAIRDNGERETDTIVRLGGRTVDSYHYTRIRDARRGAKRLKKRLIEAAKKAEIVEVG